MTYKEIGRLPAWWNDTGVFAPTAKGWERYKWLIGDELPEYVSLCEDGSLIAPLDFDNSDFDIDKIVHDAYVDLIFYMNTAFGKENKKMKKDTFWIEARNRRLDSAAKLLKEYEENRFLYKCFNRLKNRRLCTVIAELKMAKFIEENLC